MVLIYLGIMFGVNETVLGLNVIAKHASKVALKNILKIALTKTVGQKVEVKLTKQNFAKIIYKVIQVAGGVVS